MASQRSGRALIWPEDVSEADKYGSAEVFGLVIMLTELCARHRVELGAREVRCYALAVEALNRWAFRDSLPLIFSGGELSPKLLHACIDRLNSMALQRDAMWREIGHSAPPVDEVTYEIYLEHIRKFETLEFYDDERNHFNERLILGKLKRAESKRTRGLIEAQETRQEESQIARDEIRGQLRELQRKYPHFSLKECQRRVSKMRKRDGQIPNGLRRIQFFTRGMGGKRSSRPR